MNQTHERSAHAHADEERWKHDGVRVIPGNQLDPNVPSTPGMDRKAAINFARAGAQKLWAGTVTIKPDAKTGAPPIWAATRSHASRSSISIPTITGNTFRVFR